MLYKNVSKPSIILIFFLIIFSSAIIEPVSIKPVSPSSIFPSGYDVILDFGFLAGVTFENKSILIVSNLTVSIFATFKNCNISYFFYTNSNSYYNLTILPNSQLTIFNSKISVLLSDVSSLYTNRIELMTLNNSMLLKVWHISFSLPEKFR